MLTTAKWTSFVGVLATAVWLGFDLGSKQAPYASLSTLFVVLGAFIAMSNATAHPDPSNPNDVDLFNQLLDLLPTDDVGRFLREHEFGNDFHIAYARAIHKFAETWDSPDKHFVDANLEMARRRLFEDGRKLSEEIARRTVPDGTGERVTTWPGRRTDMQRPAHVWEDIKVLNKTAAEFSDTYDRFVEFARSKLIVSARRSL